LNPRRPSAVVGCASDDDEEDDGEAKNIDDPVHPPSATAAANATPASEAAPESRNRSLVIFMGVPGFLCLISAE